MTLKEDILSLREQGLNYNQIVQELGCAKSTVSYYCGYGQKEKTAYRSKGTKDRYRKVIQETKTVDACMDCGIHYPYYVMDFDHRPGTTKLFTISDTSSIKSLEALIEEMAKCDIVCSNCHRHRTWERLIVSENYIS